MEKKFSNLDRRPSQPKHPLKGGPAAAATAAKSLQSCPTLCDPIDGSPPGSPIPGILQARSLETENQETIVSCAALGFCF